MEIDHSKYLETGTKNIPDRPQTKMQEIKITQNSLTDQWECHIDGERIARANDVNVVVRKLGKYLRGQTK